MKNKLISLESLNFSKYSCCDCKSSFAFMDGKVICKNCRSTIDVDDGIPIFDKTGFKNSSGLASNLFELPWLYNFFVLLKNKIFRDKFLDIEKYTNNKSVLNVGCGPNVNAPYLEYDLKKIKSFYALDLSLNFVKQASDQSIFSKNNFSVASVYHLPFKDNTFDVIFLPFVLHHLPDDLDIALQECLRVSKKYVIVFDHIVSSNKFIAYFQNLYWNLFDGGFNYLKSSEWNKLLTKCSVKKSLNTGLIFKHVYKVLLEKLP
jgi:ubiquinone/menaquinone biosynthesis C-methylase UbiE